ncbi:nitronate monooxygenase [Massilia sp. PAMC28688]|uniref:NAD(P)H-dependent flavin oxidoreductase n=1 Tax=Massilia sp. PAMC28688 TaxID=2861283 RepID=UPI001C63A621|nr:nitronate monooxygenase [Massilia sp. PAMC28688]QYF94045.1 nitronate monooxygenase [Massilia sp. PAMC28688]
MWKNSEVTRRLKLAVPVVQGPFGGGMSSVELAAAVCDGGGLGSFGVHHLDAAGIGEVARRLRERTDAPFALNLWIPLDDADQPQIDDAAFARNAALLAPYFGELGLPAPRRPPRFAPPYSEQIEAVLQARPAVFSFVFGIASQAVLERCRALGIVTLGTATTVEEALALERAGVDMVVATGFEAGGHRVSFLRAAEESLCGTFALVPQVVDAVRIPVIAAGGIGDARGVAAALTLGAQAVQIGTAFLACRESNAGDVHRKMLFSDQARHTALTRVFSGRLARGIRNRLMTELQPHAAQIPPYPVQNWFGALMKKAAAAQERPDLMSLWCGQAAPLIRHQDARALMAALVEETNAIFQTRRGVA